MSVHKPDELKAIADALKRAYVFEKVQEADLLALSEVSEWVTLPEQSILLREGEPCRSLFILCSGRLVVKEAVTANTELIIARITAGDVVGELAFLDSQPASATVRTDAACELVRIDYTTLTRIFSERQALELEFLRALTATLAERLRKSNADLRRSVLSGVVGRF